MKLLLIALSMIVSSAAFAGTPQIQPAERVCGTIEASGIDGKLYVSIADRASFAGMQVNYSVQNPMEFTWTAGTCVCASGAVSPDPEYGNDYLYNLILVSDIQEDGAVCDVSIFEGDDIIDEPGIQ